MRLGPVPQRTLASAPFAIPDPELNAGFNESNIESDQYAFTVEREEMTCCRRGCGQRIELQFRVQLDRFDVLSVLGKMRKTNAHPLVHVL